MKSDSREFLMSLLMGVAAIVLAVVFIFLTGCVSASYTRSADEVTFKYRGVFKQIEDLEADVSSGSVDAAISFGSSGDTFDANEAIRDARDMVVTGVTGRVPEDEQ